MKKAILIKNGELALKGLNRGTFEDILIKNIKRSISRCGEFKIVKAQSTIVVYPQDENSNLDQAAEKISKVFGVAAYSVAALCDKDIEIIKQTALEFLADELKAVKTFKVAAKRADKSFAFKSPEICNEVGGFLLSKLQPLKVDVHHPDVIVNVEVRDKYVFIHSNQKKGAGGMPVSTAGKAALMLSGGIDSPVAGFMMAKRGLNICAVHFTAPPYTSIRAEMKVKKLASILSEYAGRILFCVVPFTEIEEAIKDNCPEELFTVLLRRAMMLATNKICQSQQLKAIVTGESLGQVASQTLDAIACTDEIAAVPVFRPCIGMDKEEIISVARKIGTFETSLEPFEDCCTVFTPKHPRTKPTLALIESAEKLYDMQKLVDEAVANTKFEGIN